MLSIRLLVPIIYLFFVLGNYERLSCQSEIANHNLQLRSKADAQPIPFAHAGIIGSTIGFVGDQQGVFTFSTVQIDQNDSIYFQAIGYQPKTLLIRELDSILYLEQEIYSLKEVVISSNVEVLKIGGTKPTRREINWEGLEMKGTEIGTYITDIPENSRVLAVNYYMKKNRCDSILFRLRVYETTEQFFNLQLLNTTDITFMVGSENKWIRIPVEEDNMVINQNIVLVTIEALQLWGIKDEKPPFSLTYDRVVNGFGSFRQHSRDKGWGGYTFKGRGLSFNLEISHE